MYSEEVTKDLHIHFTNETNDDNIIVLVFSRPYPEPLTVETIRMAWKMLRIPAGGKTVLDYPVANSIGAYYYATDNHLVSAGPYDAKAGSTWIATTTSKSLSLTEQGKTSYKDAQEKEYAY